MVTVTAFQIPGLTIWFWSNDHEPPHFHAKRRGEWEVRVNFLLDESEMIDVVWSDRAPSKKQLKHLATLAAQHRVALLEQWEAVHDNEL
ncbi:MAG: DUF4160 domain-containing protein [Planctomycetales bacterium]|nr:DUF4160 domain-containing protein [Planctomycetales bacterium]MCA9223725.1 DUF4160 domain-containing protein [Planctomycetales bacterium]